MADQCAHRFCDRTPWRRELCTRHYRQLLRSRPATREPVNPHPCQHYGCRNPAAYRVKWPHRTEHICKPHIVTVATLRDLTIERIKT